MEIKFNSAQSCRLTIERQKDGSLRLQEYDERGQRTYTEDSDGNWTRWEYDERGNPTYREDSAVDWQKWKYNERGQCTYREDSAGGWVKWEYNERGQEIYSEDSDGYVCYMTPNESDLTLAELQALLDERDCMDYQSPDMEQEM
ncbi:MAG: hypothetical protein LUH82_07885 [Clostridiales bacterium]|nr:hypothetical protein [Clostridiales bacterium]